MMKNIKWKNPIFILGNPRSGTSLLRLMLDSHTAIGIPPESHFFLWLEEKYGDWDEVFLEDYLEDLFLSTKFETWNLKKHDLKNFILSNSCDSYAKLTSLVYLFYSINNQPDISFWGDKNSLWVDKLEKIDFYYPNAYYVFIVRDGRDVACSYKSLNKKQMLHKYAPKLDNDVSEIAKKWSFHNTKVDSFLSKISINNFVKIRYEDLVNKPEETLKNVLKMLGLSLEKEQLNYFKRTRESIEPDIFFHWKEKLLKPLDVDNIGKYKNELTNDEINTFNQIAYQVLKQNSYL